MAHESLITLQPAFAALHPQSTALAVAVFLSGCVALPSDPGSTDLCALAAPASPAALPPGATPFTPATHTPGGTPGATPARAAPSIEPDAWTTYVTLAYAAWVERGVRQAVIADDETWTCFWRVQNGGDGSFHRVSFEDHRVLFVGTGPHETAGHAVHVLDVARAAPGHVLHYAVVEPSAECPVGPGDGANAPAALVVHRPTPPHPGYRFSQSGPLVYACSPTVPVLDGGTPVPYELRDPGSSLANTFADLFEPSLFVLDGPQPWHPYLAAIAPDDEAGFEERWLAVFTLGYRPSTGYALDLLTVARHGQDIHLAFHERAPGQMCAIGGAVVSPYLAVWIPKPGGTPANVTASLRTETVDCG